MKAQSIPPLYVNQIAAAQDDPYLYDMLALIYAVIFGRRKEVEKATELLKELDSIY